MSTKYSHTKSAHPTQNKVKYTRFTKTWTNKTTIKSGSKFVGAGGSIEVKITSSVKVEQKQSRHECVDCKKLTFKCCCIECYNCKCKITDNKRKVLYENKVYCSGNCCDEDQGVLNCGCPWGQCSCNDYDYDDRSEVSYDDDSDWSFDEEHNCYSPSGAIELFRREEAYRNLKVKCHSCSSMIHPSERHFADYKRCGNCI